MFNNPIYFYSIIKNIWQITFKVERVDVESACMERQPKQEQHLIFSAKHKNVVYYKW